MPTISDADASFRHEALLYSGEAKLVEWAAAFLRDGAALGEPALVVVSRRKIERLRAALGSDAALVTFADMARVGGNPARLIPLWQAFVDSHGGRNVRLRGIGEPVWAGRAPEELAECHRHESLLNLAFAGSPSLHLVCPYDVSALDPETVSRARETHPLVTVGESTESSPSYQGLARAREPFSEPLVPAPADADELHVDASLLPTVRMLVRRRAIAAGLSPPRADALVLAAHEAAANSIRHGGGSGTLRLWATEAELVVELEDRGVLARPLAGRIRPARDREDGQGLWLVNHLCDLVEQRSTAAGNVLRLRMRIRADGAYEA